MTPMHIRNVQAAYLFFINFTWSFDLKKTCFTSKRNSMETITNQRKRHLRPAIHNISILKNCWLFSLKIHLMLSYGALGVDHGYNFYRCRVSAGVCMIKYLFSSNYFRLSAYQYCNGRRLVRPRRDHLFPISSTHRNIRPTPATRK